MTGPAHIPVLLDEVVNNLVHIEDKMVVDATLGGGGHAYHLLERYPGIRLFGLDADAYALQVAGERLLQFGERVILRQGNFRDLDTLLASEGILSADALLFDLGVSSFQIMGERGFSFYDDAPLDMRMGDEQELTAADVVNRYDYTRLTQIIQEYGEERAAPRIARAIIEERRKHRLERAKDLARVVERVKKRRGRIHPATQTFQAIRMEVNGELDSLRAGLANGERILAPGGRMGVISFHSLEDRIVKQFFLSSASLEAVTKKPLRPGREEVLRNRRSRSAKLRIARKREEERE